MQAKSCLYNNKLFCLNCTDTVYGHVSLVAYQYKKYDKVQSENFEKCIEISLPTKCTSIKECILQTVNNFSMGLKSVLIGIFDCHGLKDLYLYSDAFRKKLVQIELPDVFVSKGVKPSNLFISDGPTFLLSSENLFHLHSVPSHSINFFEKWFYFSESKDFKILQFKCCGSYIKDASQNLLFFLIASVDFSVCQQINIVSFSSNPHYANIKCEQLPTCLFFPQYYVPVLKAIEVRNSVPVHKLTSGNLKGIDWQKNIAIICTTDDCLMFYEGVLKYCCKLTIPFPEIMCIKVEFSNIFSKNMNLVLISENNTVYFLTTKEIISCELVKCWTDVKETIIGDILMKGSKQVLLLMNTDMDLLQNSCVLIDLLSPVPVDLLSQNTMPDECLKTTITGLQQKVQIGKSAIQEVEHGISQKSAATIDALMRLKEFKVNDECLRSSHNFQESLVNLILHKDENKKLPSVPHDSEQPVKLLDEKQRFIDDNWIIWLLFINEGDRSICNPSMKLLLKDSQVESTQKVFVHNSNVFSFSNKSCRQIDSKSKFTIVLKVVQSFFQDNGTVCFILSWFNGSTAEFGNEIFLNEEEKVLTQHQLCFQRTTNMADFLNCKTERGVSCAEDLIFTRSLQQKIMLQISSLHSDISGLKSMLINSDTGLIELSEEQNISSSCLIFNSKMFYLFGVNFVIHSLNEKVALIEAFTRNEKEMLLYVQFLYQHLPDDVLISPCVQSEEEYLQIKKDIICALKDEVDLLVSTLSIHNISDELLKNYSTLMESQNVGNISISKETYHRIRKALVKKESSTDSLLRLLAND